MCYGRFKTDHAEEAWVWLYAAAVANGNSEEIDDAVFCRMIDRYMEQGFVYFDTAYPYHNQKSEGGSASLSGGAL